MITTDDIICVDIRELGHKFGFGRLMRLTEQCWGQYVAAKGIPGGELTVGPHSAVLVPCTCGGSDDCEWCCGVGRVTERVRRAIDDLGRAG